MVLIGEHDSSSRSSIFRNFGIFIYILLFSNRYLVESKHVEVLQKLLKDPTIQQCRLRRDGDDDLLASALPNKPAASISKSGEPEKPITANVPEDISQFYQQLDKDDDEDEATDIAANSAVAFEVDPDKIEVVTYILHTFYKKSIKVVISNFDL